MGISSAVGWWEEQQLRILVLGSLGVQYFLAFFAGRRKSRIPPWYRFCIWLSYLASDALAIYALATLFNRHNKLQCSSRYRESTSDLEVLWAPVLLMHLGGQHIITAYNIEDNELWKRHIVTALSQVTVAIYVFYKSWSASADKRLLAAAVLLFIPGIAKCFDKPLALMRASFNSITNYLDHAHSMTTSDKEEELQEYVQKAKEAMRLKDRKNAQVSTSFPDTLLLDFASPYSRRLARLKRFCPLDDKKAHDVLKYTLANIFDRLYTKDISFKTGGRFQIYFYIWTSIMSMALPVVAIGLFHKSDKEAYKHSDAIITVALLYGTLLLEFISVGGMISFGFKWSVMVAQHSLIGFLAQNGSPRRLMSFIGCLTCKDFLNQYFGMESCDSSKEITKLVRRHIQDGWEKYIEDAQSYKEFNDVSGHWTLERKGCDQLLGWSLEKPFDESVLLWHMATDFCFHHTDTSDAHECARRCREMSNYMVHLLYDNAEMLLPGSRKHIFSVVYDKLDCIVKGKIPADGRKLAKKVIDVVKSTPDSEDCFIHKAWELAEQLIKLNADNKMWEVVQGVWVEMLCFSAGRCRGYLHAKSLGSGGEYLSYVWILLANTGMETFLHKLRRTHKIRLSKEKREHLEKEEEDAAVPSTSQGMELPKEKENVAGPSLSQGEATDSDQLSEIVVARLPIR